MKIGIASPISVNSLQKYLHVEEEAHLRLGMGGPAVNNLVAGHLENGHDVTVYSLDLRVKGPLVLRGEKLKIIFGHYRPSGRQRMLDLFARETAQIKQFIKEDQPDIVNAHWTYEYALGAIQSGVPHLLTFRDLSWEILKLNKDLYRTVRFLLDFKVRRQGSFFNVNSPYLRDKLAGFKKELPVVPNSVAGHYLADKGRTHPAGNFKIVTVAGNWSKLKNVSTALEAFKLLRGRFGERVEYHLIGNDYAPNGLAENWAKDHGCTDGVHFRGRIDHATLMQTLKEFNALLHPSLEESFGNTLIEAMGCGGIPVIGGKDSGAVPWVLDHGKYGLLVDVTVAPEMADALERLVVDADLYNQLSSTGLAYVKDTFGTRQVARQYEALYRQVLKSQGLPVLNDVPFPG